MVNCDIPWGDNYVGEWIGDPARQLNIRKVKDQHYLATLLIDGRPIARPWMDNAPTVAIHEVTSEGEKKVGDAISRAIKLARSCWQLACIVATPGGG